MLNRGFTSHSQIILSLLYNAKFFDFYFLLKTKVLTSGFFFSIYIALDFPMLLCNNNTFNFVSQPGFSVLLMKTLRVLLYTGAKD